MTEIMVYGGARKDSNHGKMVIVDDKKYAFEENEGNQIFLQVDIKRVKMISSSSYSLLPIHYYVVAWITSPFGAALVHTRPWVVGMPVPSTSKQCCYVPIPIDEHLFTTSLSLEVIRAASIDEAGTSTGEILLGKARIRLSKTFKKPVEAVCDLVKNMGTGCRLQGQLEVNLKVWSPKKHKSPEQAAAAAAALAPPMCCEVINIDDDSDVEIVHQNNNNRRRKRRRDRRNQQVHRRYNLW
ncbi:hypothetical protein NE237_028694 [Protea cynaroides]|uniref:Uncharacterized protein n=1 Tax=Protea cynaroides TaxID=273540 RepID=A0A9Q0GPU8_9MAGN|nr:hypothetical protein NE237_028694 [Protea cynaroides]